MRRQTPQGILFDAVERIPRIADGKLELKVILRLRIFLRQAGEKSSLRMTWLRKLK
jgi:hypothetical protein